MGYLACPVCERESLVNVSDLQQRVATALIRPLSCPICSASVSGLQAFHHHLAAHLPNQHNSYADATPLTPTHNVSGYTPTHSPDAIPNLEHLEISDGAGSPRSPSVGIRKAPEERESTVERSASSKSLQELSPAPIQEHVNNNCDLCGLVFSSEHFLKIHKDIIHTKSDYFDVSCKLCKEKFKDFEAYRQHVRESHSDRRYICDQCPKTFKMKGSLLVHTRMFHDPCSPGKCQVCSKTFTTKARKELHEKRYHGIGLEHLFASGKASPPSPSSRHQRTASSSSLGDAKNWLETLVTENKSMGDASLRMHEHAGQPSPSLPFPQQSPTQLQFQSTSGVKMQQHFSLAEHPMDQSFGSQSHDHGELLTHEDQVHQSMATDPVHQPADSLQQDAQAIRRGRPRDSALHPSWVQECPPHMFGQDVTQTKMSPDGQVAPFKHSAVPPGHILQQHAFHGSRSSLDCTELKQEKVPLSAPPSCPEASVTRIVGGHAQQSPVAVVSPQPHKSETPPAGVPDPPAAATEARRNSFPLISLNKPVLPPADATRLHASSYASDFSFASPSGVPVSPGQSACQPALGDKMQGPFPASQPLLYQPGHGSLQAANYSPGLTLIGSAPDTKLGVRVPPIVIPAAQMYASDKLKESPDSPSQMAKALDGGGAQDAPPALEAEGADAAAIRPQESPGDGRPDGGRSQRTGAAGGNAAPSSKKEGGSGKGDGKQWECEVCKKSFTTKYFLKKHKRLHTGETPYACEECGKTFTFQQSYHKHILYHSDDKPHQCSYCGRAFKEMSTLHNHVRIHTGEKPFVCETCGKAFRQRVSYLVHQRIHTGVMPYTCDVCNRSFRYKVSLRSHRCEPNAGSSPGGGGGGGGGGAASRKELGGGGERGRGSPATPSAPNTGLHPLTPLRTANTTVGAAPVAASKAGETGAGESSLMPLPSASPSAAVSRESDVSAQQHQQHQQAPQDAGAFSGKLRVPLQTIDLAAIAYDGLSASPEGKRPQQQHHRASGSSRSPPGSSSSSRAGGSQGSHDPLSMAFLHALVDPQQARLQGDCRPHVALPPEALPFPSLSPGAMDADMEHDSFLTNLLM
ncbi:zinc finger protein 628-like [Penaeus japonicus]|uniref:zinc finger protein 628-like n=1 Tax=Penaeus japonicus TaxID=27405 RepID=UPI001C714B8C|nr:zinc finger protein 628-like [Penaeus japonicus]